MFFFKNSGFFPALACTTGRWHQWNNLPQGVCETTLLWLRCSYCCMDCNI